MNVYDYYYNQLDDCLAFVIAFQSHFDTCLINEITLSTRHRSMTVIIHILKQFDIKMQNGGRTPDDRV